MSKSKGKTLRTDAEEMDAAYRKVGMRAFRPSPERMAAMAAMARGPRVLDFGCGSGRLLLRLQKANPGWQLCGVDISAVALEYARLRGVACPLVAGTSIPPGPWDTIIMGQVLEHVPDDRGLLAEARAELAPGGRLLVSVPNGDKVKSPWHLRDYDEAALLALLGEFGPAAIADWPGRAVGVRIIATVDIDAE